MYQKETVTANLMNEPVISWWMNRKHFSIGHSYITDVLHIPWLRQLSNLTANTKPASMVISSWPPYGIGQAIIFLPCGFFLSSIFFSFFPHLISAAADWMSTILPHMLWP